MLLFFRLRPRALLVLVNLLCISHALPARLVTVAFEAMARTRKTPAKEVHAKKETSRISTIEPAAERGLATRGRKKGSARGISDDQGFLHHSHAGHQRLLT